MTNIRHLWMDSTLSLLNIILAGLALCSDKKNRLKKEPNHKLDSLTLANIKGGF